MPAPPSSLIDPAIGHLVELAGDGPAEQPGLLAMLARVADPRHRRGVRHRLAVILGLALCAVVAGARSFTAIAEWAADADGQTLEALGVTGRVPSESTFRRTLQRLDADAFDELAGAWAQQATRPGPNQRRVIAVDGKTLRGSASRGEPGDHLLAALDHAHGAVLGQVEVGAKTNEIPMFPRPAGPHRHHRCGHHRRRAACPASATPPTWPGAARTTCSPSSATSQACTPSSPPCPGARSRSPARPASADTAALSSAPSKSPPSPPGWPSRTPPRPSRSCAAASLPEKKWSRETVYAITSLTATQASPAELAAIIRGHWAIEDRLHWVRDLDYDEDRSQIRTAGAPRVMATLRNVALTILRLAGHASIAAALRYHSRRPDRPLRQGALSIKARSAGTLESAVLPWPWPS